MRAAIGPIVERVPLTYEENEKVRKYLELACEGVDWKALGVRDRPWKTVTDAEIEAAAVEVMGEGADVRERLIKEAVREVRGKELDGERD